jgi:acetyl esterase/lipase
LDEKVSRAFLAVSIVGALVVANAWRPLRRQPFGVASFVLGWIPSELPLHVAAVGIGVTALFGALGALSAGPGEVGLAVAVVSWVVLGWLAVVAERSRLLVDEALDEALGGTRAGVQDESGGSESGGSDDSGGRRGEWWRLLLAVPYRPLAVVKSRNVDYWGDGAKRHRLDVLARRAPAPANAPVLLYVHGGAWVIGEKREQGRPMLYELARRGWVCVTLNYRLAPKTAWPDQLVDCKRAIAWVRAHIDEYGGDPRFIAVSGGSAGGHLCSMLALTPGEPAWQPGFEDEDTSVDACLPFYGVYDLTGDPDGMGLTGPGFLRFLEKQIMQTSAVEHPEVFEQASPDRRASEGAPPMLVFHGRNDSLVPVEVARRFVDRLRACSRAPVGYVELPRTQHAFDVLTSIRCRRTTRGALRFLEDVRHRVADREPD